MRIRLKSILTTLMVCTTIFYNVVPRSLTNYFADQPSITQAEPTFRKACLPEMMVLKAAPPASLLCYLIPPEPLYTAEFISLFYKPPQGSLRILSA